MNPNEERQSTKNEGRGPASPAEFSTSRRTLTAILVLVAALLLGYVLYDVLLNNSYSDQELPETEVLIEPEAELSVAEKQVILEAMQEEENVELLFEEDQERRLMLESMDTTEDDVSEEDRAAVLKRMQ